MDLLAGFTALQIAVALGAGPTMAGGIGAGFGARRGSRPGLARAPEIDDVARHRAQSAPAAKVSQASISPLSKPRLNQVWRCSDVPWVKLSGLT